MEDENVYDRIRKQLFPSGWDYEQEDHFYIIMVECDDEYAEHVMPVPYDGVSQSIAKAAICMLEQDDPSIPGDYWVAFSRACSDPATCAVCVRREEELEAATRDFLVARARERAALGPQTKAQKDAAFAEWELELGPPAHLTDPPEWHRPPQPTKQGMDEPRVFWESKKGT